MKKIITISSIILVLVLLAGCVRQQASQSQLASTIPVPVAEQPVTQHTAKPVLNQNIYLKHFGNKESTIIIDCKKDSDCKLIHLGISCRGFGSINANNNDIEIEKYISTEQELTRGVDFSCADPIPMIENSRPVCKNNQCAFEKK